MALILTEGLGQGGGGGGGDLAIDNIVPATAYILPGSVLEFDLTDTSGTFLAVFSVAIEFPSLGYSRVVWDGSGFLDPYGASSRTSITGGYHFSISSTDEYTCPIVLHVLYANQNGDPSDLSHSWSWYAVDPTPPVFALTSIAGEPNTIRLIFPSNISLTGDSAVYTNYIVTPLNGGDPVDVTGLSIYSSNQLLLATTDQSEGKLYQLDIPTGLKDSYDQDYVGPFSPTFLGDSGDAQIVMARCRDAYTVEVVFKAPVDSTEATTASNYSIDNDATVLSVVQVSDIIYRLKTSKLEEDLEYTITATGIGYV